MSSTLYVDKVVEKTSAAGVHIPGHVIQVVNNKGTGGSGTTSTSWSAVSSVVTITPKFATSKIVVQFFATAYAQDGSAYFTIARDGVPIGDGANDGLAQMNRNGDSNPFYMPSSLSTYVSSIGSTASTEFRVYVRVAAGASGYWPAGSVDQWTAYAWEIAQ